MAIVKEKELSKHIESFNHKNITITITGVFSQISRLQLAECNYHSKDGKLKISDNISSFEIDLSFVHSIEINSELNSLAFYLDNNIELTIAK